jgi:hypothetical protein
VNKWTVEEFGITETFEDGRLRPKHFVRGIILCIKKIFVFEPVNTSTFILLVATNLHTIPADSSCLKWQKANILR